MKIFIEKPNVNVTLITAKCYDKYHENSLQGIRLFKFRK